MKHLLFTLSILCVWACASDKKQVPESGISFTTKGATFDTINVYSYNELLKSSVDKDSIVDIQVRARVDAVCQTKGCWMSVASEQEGMDTMYVEFKDYGFFMPADIAGKEVVMKGNLYKEITSIEELKYAAQEEGLAPSDIEQISKPLEEIFFVAEGVHILP